MFRSLRNTQTSSPGLTRRSSLQGGWMRGSCPRMTWGEWPTGLMRAPITALSVLTLLALPGTGHTQDVFAGKTLSIFAGFPPGGGVDGEMRVLTRYFAKYIPGNPVIVSRNMQGAGGIVLANHLYNVAAADGLTLGMPG